MENYLSQTEIGRVYGVSSHVVGKWLKDLGLRNSEGFPTDDAKAMVSKRQSTNLGTWISVWDREQVLEVLDKMGYPRETAFLK